MLKIDLQFSLLFIINFKFLYSKKSFVVSNFNIYRPNGFFSYTETETEISLIFSDLSKDIFPEALLNTTGESWRLIKVADGPLGFSTSEICSINV